jgi:glycosyltransferase involved in cell wall biosynthesis
MTNAEYLTIAVCTYNRARLLNDMLQSFAATIKPAGASFEVLIIDNNSRDDTRSVVEAWLGKSEFPIRYVFETRQGLARARNRAVEESRGDWIWYTDDDIYFSPGWLEQALRGTQIFPDASALTGRIVLEFEPVKPDWLPASVLPYYGMTTFGDQRRWLMPPELPVGANTAFRRRVFNNIGLFREDLGRVASSLISCEESEIAMRLHQRLYGIGYVPDAMVRHRVSSDRATISWLRKRAFWGGVSNVLLAQARTRCLSRRQLIKQGSEVIREVGRAALKNGFGVEDQLKYMRQLGVARQFLLEAASPRRAVKVGLIRS